MLSSIRRARAVQIEVATNWFERRSANPRSGRLAALRYRLNEIGPHLVPGWRPDEHQTTSTASLLKTFARAVRDSGESPEHWLLFAGVAGSLPTEDALLAFERAIRLASSRDLVATVVEHAVVEMSHSHSHYRTIQVLAARTVADVDFCATHSFNSGIQRVVRNTLQRWEGDRECTLVAWDDVGRAMRPLTKKEVSRVLAWGRPEVAAESAAPGNDRNIMIVPWRSRVLLPETAALRFAARLAALAQYSGNTTAAIAYDTIPLTSAAFVSTDESLVFSAYLNIIKRVDLLLPISEAASEEFRGFRDALEAQGKPGPRIETVTLPEAAIPAEADFILPSDTPLIVSVGSFEGRKNQLGTMDAAEILWRKGLDFTLVLVGGSAQPWFKEVDRRMAELVLAGRPISRLSKVTDGTLAAAYQVARFTVFTSLHEGYGLPVVESLAAGTPVIATSYGSVGAIARQGGCVLIDPRDIGDIAKAMERLLTDDLLLESLKEEIEGRPKRTWDDYAAEIWGELETVGVAQ